MCDYVNIINGNVEKADGTFFYPFFFTEIQMDDIQSNITIGSYPESEIDI